MFRTSDQYSGYSDFTASSEALKSGVTTACEGREVLSIYCAGHMTI